MSFNHASSGPIVLHLISFRRLVSATYKRFAVAGPCLLNSLFIALTQVWTSEFSRFQKYIYSDCLRLMLVTLLTGTCICTCTFSAFNSSTNSSNNNKQAQSESSTR